MDGFTQKINESKKKYLSFAIENEARDLYIFGAGRMAKPLLSFYEENSIEVKGFCVTDLSCNKKEESGKRIVSIDDLIGKSVAIAFGVNPRLNNEIEKIMVNKGFEVYLKASEYLRYFGSYGYDFYNNPMLEITTKMGCSVNCKYCPQDVLLKNYFLSGDEKRVLEFIDFKKCIDKLPNNTLIEFAGFTEPFLNPRCVDMIRYAYERGYKVNLFTTLVGASIDIIEAIRDIQFEEFVLHVPDEEGFSHIPTTEEYLRMLDMLVVMKKPNGDDYIDYACSQGTVPSQIKKHLGRSVRIFVSLLDRAGNLDDDMLFGVRGVKGRIRCEVSKTINHNVLLPDGRLVLCAQDYSMQHVLGNLIEDDYKTIMNGETTKGINNSMMSVDKEVLCRNCSLARVIS